MNYKLTINANICFDYYPYSKTTSEEVPYIINKEEIDFYDEWHDVELEITPKMLLECIDFVYGNHHDTDSISYLIIGLQNNQFYFEKLCAEIFDEENLDSNSKIYDYLTSCDEYKKKERQIIENEVRTLGELYE